MAVKMPVIRIISAKEAVQRILDFISQNPDINISNTNVCHALKDCSDDIRGLVLFLPAQLIALWTLGENGRRLFHTLRPYCDEITMVYGQFGFRPQTIDYVLDHCEAGCLSDDFSRLIGQAITLVFDAERFAEEEITPNQQKVLDRIRMEIITKPLSVEILKNFDHQLCEIGLNPIPSGE